LKLNSGIHEVVSGFDTISILKLDSWVDKVVSGLNTISILELNGWVHEVVSGWKDHGTGTEAERSDDGEEMHDDSFLS
jgi:hypothetical protein